MTPPDPANEEAGGTGNGLLVRLLLSQKRQVRNVVDDVARIRGMMPLLMKHRNGGHWTRKEKAQLLVQLRLLSRVSPLLLLLLLPGSVFLLPAYAWLLDRRLKRRRVARALANRRP